MATRNTPSAEAEESPEQAARTESDAPAAKGAVGEYLDETPRTYLWPDGPQTVVRGDVVALPDGWEQDGRFGPSSKKPTRLRDNHPDQAAKTSAAQTKARDDVHARLAEEA